MPSSAVDVSAVQHPGAPGAKWPVNTSTVSIPDRRCSPPPAPGKYLAWPDVHGWAIVSVQPQPHALAAAERQCPRRSVEAPRVGLHLALSATSVVVSGLLRSGEVNAVGLSWVC